MAALVLLPGLDGTGLLFADFVAELQAVAPEIEPIVVRYPGDRALGYAELERIARESLPSDRPFVLLGESFSGPIAISIAASRPAGLVGLILCCTFARYPRPLLRRLHRLAPFVPVAGSVVTVVRRVVAPGPVAEPVRAKLTMAREMVSKGVMRARVGELLRVDLTAKLAEIEVPILDLRANRDGIVPNRAADEIRRFGRQVREVDMNGPHFLLLANPKETAEAVRDFLATCR